MKLFRARGARRERVLDGAVHGPEDGVPLPADAALTYSTALSFLPNSSKSSGFRTAASASSRWARTQPLWNASDVLWDSGDWVKLRVCDNRVLQRRIGQSTPQ